MSSALDVLVEPLASPGVMAAKLWLPFGSACDATDQRGAHDLLASLLSRGCGPYNPRELADVVEGYGAGLRCDAQEDGLLLSLRCTIEDAEQLLPVLGWMVLEPHLEADQVALEKRLTLQTLQRQREDPFHIAAIAWRELAFSDGGYGHDPMGVERDLQRIERQQILPLAQQLPNGRSVLSLAGCLPKDIEKRIFAMDGFRGWPQASANWNAGRPNYGTSAGETIRLESMDTEQVVLMLGQATVSHGHPDDLVLRLLQCHLGVGMSSLLFRRLREEHGVAYEVAVHYPQLIGPAPFVLLAATGMERAELSLRLLLQSWDELCQTTLSQADLTLARAKFIGQMAQARQTCSQRAERRVQLRAMELSDDHDQSCMEAIHAITVDHIQETCQRWFQRPQLSLCGPPESFIALERIWAERRS